MRHKTQLRRSPLAFIFITVFIDLLGAGMILPLLPFYAQQYNADALTIGALGASFALFQLIFAPVLGALSDRFGRRPVLLLSLIGSAISYIIFGLAASLVVLFIGRILDGITGGNILIAQAYIADSTPPEKRARGLGVIGAAFGLGFMLGPVFGGLLSMISLSAPAFAAATIALANAAFGYLVLPESLPAERRSTTPLTKMNPATQVYEILQIREVRPLLLTILLLNLAFAGIQSNFAVFSNARFGWDATANAFLFAFIGVMAVLTQGYLLGRLQPYLGEVRLALSGLVFMSIGFGLIALAQQDWLLYPAVAILALGSGLSTPSLGSLISRRVSEREQGKVMGGQYAAVSTTMVIGPLIAGWFFDSIGTSAPYWFGVVLLIIALVVAISSLLPTLRAEPASASSSSLANALQEGQNG